MEEMGMTDLQFKSFLRMMVNYIEEAKAEESKEGTDEKLDKVLENLKADLEG